MKLLAGMFRGAVRFNKDLNNWNVSNVTNMKAMFAGASSFNQDLNNWDVSKVKNMAEMFEDATAFIDNQMEGLRWVLKPNVYRPNMFGLWP